MANSVLERMAEEFGGLKLAAKSLVEGLQRQAIETYLIEVKAREGEIKDLHLVNEAEQKLSAARERLLRALLNTDEMIECRL